MKKVLRFLAALAVMSAAVTAAYILAVKPQTSLDDSGRIRVVAAANFWGDIAHQIGGERVSVTELISGSEIDPHLYETTASGAGVTGSADLVIINGLGYDDFLEKIVAGGPAGDRHVLRAHEVTGTPAGANPHLWYDPAKAVAVAAAVRDKLEQIDPAHSGEYRRNYAAFEAAMKPVAAAAEQIMTDYPGAAVAYTERVPEYMLAAAGLRIVTPAGFAQAIEDGNDASPADTAAMEELINKRRIEVLLYNSQATSAVTVHIRKLAEAAGIPVVPITETIPEGEPDFQTWQLHQINALGAALNVR